MNDCIIWTGSVDGRGYGRLWRDGKHHRAHRVAYAAVYGPIPVGLVIDHLCRVKLCVNPTHLEAVSHGENTRRGVGPAAVNATKTHCPRGHPYSRIVKRSSGRPTRACHPCDAMKARKYRSKV